MKEKDIQGILHKVKELKTFFNLGTKFVPFLEDMLLFVEEMAPMLQEMNKSIQDSSAKMPKAVQQLDKVTSATETATNEILDKVDGTLAKLDEVTSGFQTVNQCLEAQREAVSVITANIEKLLKLPGTRKRLGEVFEDEKAREYGMKIKDVVDNFMTSKVEGDILQKAEQLIQDIQTDAFDIMNALQVQDITSQQIEGAHAMLRSVQERLNNLITRYSEAEPTQVIERANKAFDMEATFDDSEDRQQIADELASNVFEEIKEGQDEPETADKETEEEPEAISGQDEIDSFIEEAVQSDGQAPETGEIPETEALDTTMDQVQSQEEIDRLMEESLAGEEQSAEEAGIETAEDATGDETVEGEETGVASGAGPKAETPVDLLDDEEKPGLDAAQNAAEEAQEVEKEREVPAVEEAVEAVETAQEAEDEYIETVDEIAGEAEKEAVEADKEPEKTVEEIEEIVEEAGVAKGGEEEETPEEVVEEAEEEQDTTEEPAAGEKKEDDQKPAEDDSAGNVSISQDEIDKLFQ